MLQLRICPKCGAEIKSKTAFFCYACGKELEPPKTPIPEESQEEPRPQKEEISLTIPAFLFTLIKLIGLFLIILTLGSGIGILCLRYKDRIIKTKKTPLNQVFIEESFQPLENSILWRSVLPELTPATVDIYIEGTKPEIVLPKIFGRQFGEDFENQVGLNLPEAASFLEEQFALFEKIETTPSGEIAFVSKARDPDFVEKRLEELSPETSPSAVMVENYLVFSNSPNLIKEIERSLRKLSLSLALKTEFAESLRHLPEKGQLLVYLTHRDGKDSSGTLRKAVRDWIPDSLTGNGFMIIEENGRTKVVGEVEVD